MNIWKPTVQNYIHSDSEEVEPRHNSEFSFAI